MTEQITLHRDGDQFLVAALDGKLRRYHVSLDGRPYLYNTRPEDHDISLEPATDYRSGDWNRAVCVCGWEGHANADDGTNWDAGKDHIEDERRRADV